MFQSLYSGQFNKVYEQPIGIGYNTTFEFAPICCDA